MARPVAPPIQPAKGANLVKREALSDGSTMYQYDDGVWLVFVPGRGVHKLIAVDQASTHPDFRIVTP